jgi:rhodanese-related sulfurtransferase
MTNSGARPTHATKWFIGLWILLMCLGGAAAGQAEKEAVVRWISVADLDTLLRQIRPVVVDLRTPGEYAAGHLAGAVNIPVGDLKDDPSLLDKYKDAPVLLYCRTVNRTGLAIRILKGRGFKALFALRGGYEAVRTSGKQRGE